MYYLSMYVFIYVFIFIICNHTVAWLQVFQAHLNIMHWSIGASFASIISCHVTTPLLCSKYHSRKHAFGALNKTALFAEDTSGSKFEAPILRPRKRLLHGTNFYCLGSLAAHRDSKVSPSHFSIRVLEASSLHSHTLYIYIFVERERERDPNNSQHSAWTDMESRSTWCPLKWFITQVRCH